jgi:hypothetical protein
VGLRSLLIHDEQYQSSYCCSITLINGLVGADGGEGWTYLKIRGYGSKSFMASCFYLHVKRSNFVSDNPGGISQSNSGSMAGGMQAAIGNHNRQMTSNEGTSASNVPTQAEVSELLAQMAQMIRNAELPEAVKEKVTKYIEAAKIEAEEAEPDKQLISKNLERVTKNLEEVDKTVDASKRIFEKVVPIVIKVASWLGTAAASLWAMLP